MNFAIWHKYKNIVTDPSDISKDWDHLLTPSAFEIPIKGNFACLLLFSCSVQFVVVVQSLSHVQLFATPWTAAHQAPLSFTIFQSLLKLVSIEPVMPFNHLILWHTLLLLPSIFPSIRVFANDWLFPPGGQRTVASASILPMHNQGWFPLGLTDLISLHSKGFSRVFSNTTVQKHQFFYAQLSL